MRLALGDEVIHIDLPDNLESQIYQCHTCGGDFTGKGVVYTFCSRDCFRRCFAHG